jgi:O-antigen/teichoic acid export membrane protein
MPFLKGTIGPKLLGLRTLAMQALQFVALLSHGVSVSFKRFATAHYARGEYKQMNEAASVGLIFSLLAAGIFITGTFVAVVFARQFFDLPVEIVTLARVVILITGLTMAFHVISGVWTTPMTVRQRMYLDSIASIISAVGAAVAVWIAFQFSSPSIIIWVALACGFRVGAELFFVIPMCRRALPQFKVRLRTDVPRQRVREIISFGALSFVGGLGHLLYFSTDSIIISNLDNLGVGEVFYYGVAQRWDPQVRTGITGFVAALTPMMTQFAAVGDMDRLRRVLVRAIRYSLILGALPCILLVAFASPFLGHWLGPDVAERSAPVMRLIMSCLLLSIPAVVGFAALLAVGRIAGAVWCTVVGGVLNIILSVFFGKILWMGLTGVALGSVIALAMTYWFAIPLLTVRHTGVPFGEYLRAGHARAFAAMVPLAAACALMRWLWEPSSMLWLAVHVVLCSLIYAVGVAVLGLTREDRAKLVRGAVEVRRMVLAGIGVRKP